MKLFIGLLSFAVAFAIGSVRPAASFTLGLNERLASELGGAVLHEERVTLDMTVPLDSVLAGPVYDKSNPGAALLGIHFRRDDLTPEFLLSFFDPRNQDIRIGHPFAARGVESVLTKDELILLIHPGVVLRVRNNVPRFPYFRTFRTDSAFGIVRLALGEFLISRDQDTIRDKLDDLWTRNAILQTCSSGTGCTKAPDGSVLGFFGKADLPPFFHPRVVD